MKTLFLLFIGSFLVLPLSGQVISGTLLDKLNNEKVPFAAIYFSGTFVGTTSDIEGNFSLDVSNNKGMPLSVSCMGYHSLTIDDFLDSEPLIIYLEPKDFKVDEVTVTAKSLVRKRKSDLRIFKKEFLGSSVNATSCEILNEEDIYFNYESDSDTLKAFATKPLQIKNQALGYNITYFLDQFEYYRESKSFLYEGNILFEEDLTQNNQSDIQECENRRRTAYLGSRMHFLRSLWLNELETSGFSISNADGKSLGYNNIVIQEAGNIQDATQQFRKYISFPFPIYIYYNVDFSTMILLKQRVNFEKSGIHSEGILWEGDMLKKRIGDTLPYEYGL